MIIPLKAKYRIEPNKLLKREHVDPPDGTRVYQAGRFKPKTSNAGKAVKGAPQGSGARMKAYWGNVLR